MKRPETRGRVFFTFSIPLSGVKTGACGARYIAFHKITLRTRLFSVRLGIACESERLIVTEFYKMGFSGFKEVVFQTVAVFLFLTLFSISSFAEDSKSFTPETHWRTGSADDCKLICKGGDGYLLHGICLCSNDAVENLSTEQRNDLLMRIQEWEPDPASAASLACKSSDDCKNFCKGAGSGKECLPDGVPVCEKNVCGCSLTCR
ncbi:MAG: hypothetical protein EPN97_17080 [Alphaproteobacteria bacterium]|nr:MAG: hypothetical protein EPN97_17080 [Alphaproteobacteria bacterium]